MPIHFKGGGHCRENMVRMGIVPVALSFPPDPNSSTHLPMSDPLLLTQAQLARGGLFRKVCGSLSIRDEVCSPRTAVRPGPDPLLIDHGL